MIAQGIQKGIDLYKKQQKEKARAFNKRFKKAPPQKEGSAETDEPDAEEMIIYQSTLISLDVVDFVVVGNGRVFFP